MTDIKGKKLKKERKNGIIFYKKSYLKLFE